jgi:ABC-type uncharacterized transport system ATPase subunit
MLEIENLHAYYGKSHILQGISLRVGEGEIVSLLGRNGAGRSTTIKTIMGEVVPVGSIRFKRERIDGLKPHQIARRGLGYVPEDRAIFPSLTVIENLALGMKSAQSSGRWTMEDMFELFPVLRARAHAPGGVLSGGEQQMLTICRTLMGDPDLIMVRADRGPGAEARRTGPGAAREDRGARHRHPAHRTETDHRAQHFAAPVRDGSGTHRVRGHPGRSADEPGRAQGLA